MSYLRRLSILFPVLLLALPLSAQQGDLTDTDRAAIRTVIERQLEALRQDDAAGAFALASPEIQAKFETPERFLTMVQTWYQAVLEAQKAAIAAAKSGAACEDVDGAARQVLAGYHLDHLFVHSTGHGLGLEVHEDPRVARGQKKRLEPGNVITIEPGVYSAGIGGIRIEDDVAVHADHTEVLTRAPRDLIEI